MTYKSWLIGNTTVRSPYRLREALTVLKNSEFHGNLRGKDREEGFAILLNQRGIVKAERSTRLGDLGRKWRSALGQLGFVVNHLTHNLKKPIDPKLERFVTDIPSLSGRPYEITPNGLRLLQSDTIAEQQECFLRALAAYNIPSIIEESYKFLSFSPLKFVLQILLHLEKIGKESMIKFEEMSLVVQHRSPDNGFNNVVSELLSYRNERNKADKKRGFAWNWFKEIIGGNETKFRTSNDYADCNFRYLKATGLFQAKGRAITLVPEKRTLIELMVSGDEERRSDAAYVKNLWNGAELPTDDKLKTIDIIRDLARQLETHGEKPEIGNLGVQTAADLSQVRYRLEDQLRCFKELSFAREQSDLREKIADCMKSFINYKRSRVKVEFPAGVTFNVPRGEQPAYFEWIIWRAFLAIDSLENKPWEARKFNVDQDFLPLSHAPAGRPDMVFWFEEYILVVEVTLTSSSRQEAAEGEPVRRHVAEIAEKYEDTGKKIYCLFIALNIDNNTAETFKIGRWYKKDDTKLPLQIVPVTLDDFIRLFESDRLDPAKLKLLLTECRAVSNQDAPEWKKAISTEIRDSFT